MDDRTAFTMRIDKQLLEALDELAWRSRKSRSEFILEALEKLAAETGVLPSEYQSYKKKKPGRSKKSDL